MNNSDKIKCEILVYKVFSPFDYIMPPIHFFKKENLLKKAALCHRFTKLF
ncbi:hypothetical protein B4140_0182 [Bacillus amyloliquefaciens]|nr:hypothetical protein B4140_0182 [Bacillus amyloliquefaciens]